MFKNCFISQEILEIPRLPYEILEFSRISQEIEKTIISEDISETVEEITLTNEEVETIAATTEPVEEKSE